MAGALGVGTSTAVVCCGDAHEPDAAASAGAGADTDVGEGAGRAGRDGRAGGSGSSSTAAAGGGGEGAVAPDGFWAPSGDPEWQGVDWAPDCLIEAASKPEHAMPPLSWQACDGLPGCERFDPNWYVKSQIYLGFASGYRRGKSARLGIATEWGDGKEWRSAVYGESWKPLAVWRGPSDGCNGVSPQPSPEHVCVRSAKLGGMSRGGLLSPADLRTPLVTFETKGRLSMSCTASLAVGFDSAGNNYIFDVEKAAEVQLSVPSGEALQPEAYGATAYFSRWYTDANQKEALDGWIWTPAGGATQLIDPADKFVADLRSDGTNLAWLELDMTTINHAAAGKLWRSPLTDDPATVERALVRDVPSANVTAFHKVVGGGFYALIEQHDDQSMRNVHVYRLEDGHHWQVPLPDDLIASTLVWLDTDELMIATALPSGASHGLMRQTLSALGEGD